MKCPLKLIIFIGLLLVNISRLTAQHDDWRSYLEQLAEEEMSSELIENIFQELLMLENEPLNLNSVTREQLERMPLLNYEQAVGIYGFLDKNRPVYTVYELRNVPQLDFNTVQLILPFFYVGEVEKEKTTLAEMLKWGKNEVQMRFDKTLNQRAGYAHYSDSILERYPNRKYRGEDFYHSLKYSFAYRDKIQFGLVGEKDAGEPFWQKGYTKGYDHYGFHLLVRDIGNLKTLALGDYRLSFGQGLVLNNDFTIIKSWASNNIIKSTTEPRRHHSTAEYGFFRGVAAVYQINKVNLTAFYSNKQFDANLSLIGEMTSFKTDGLHRTPLEMEKKNNTREQVAGGNINYRNGALQVGGSVVYHKYSRWLNPKLNEYNIYYLRDNSNVNASIDYSYRLRLLTIAGETAIAGNGAVATTNMIQYSPSYTFALSALYRHLPVTYNALHAGAFMENSRVQNEQGLFIGTTFNPVRKVSATAYVDLFKFPWLKSQVDAPSDGMEVYLLSSYNMNKSNSFEIRYRYKQKEQNAYYPDKDTKTVLPYNTQKARLRWNANAGRGWSFRTTADFAIYSQRHFKTESGYMISQNMSHRGNSKVQGDFFAGYFNSDSYAARLYSYERNIMSTFYMPSFYGEGLRFALSGRYNITSNLSFSVKAAHTQYFNRESIGSGTELIEGKSRTDIYTFLRWKF